MQHRSIRIVLFFALLFTLPLLAAEKAVAAERIYMVSHAGVGDPFWVIVFNGAHAAAEESGVALTILAPETPNDITRQLELFQQALRERPDGIALTISDPHLFSRLLHLARRRGIPVIAFNTRPYRGRRSDNPYLAYIGMDDHLAGRVLARRLLQMGKAGRHVVVANQQVGHPGLAARVRGIREVLEPEGVAVDMLDITSNPITSQRVMREYLRTHPGIDAIITLGPIGTRAVERFLLSTHRSIPVAAFDISPRTLRLIEQGVVLFTIDQQPFMQGYLAVKMLMLAARYKMSPPEINTGVGIVDRDNIAPVRELVKAHLR